MKVTKYLIGTLFTVVSAGLAFGCGCPTQSVRLEPVREMTIRESSTCLAEPTRRINFWSPFQKAGQVISTPFVAMGRAFRPSDSDLVPVGERLDPTIVTYETSSLRSRALIPVGERITTIRTKTYKTVDLQPVGERVIVRRNFCPSDLPPVSERILIRSDCPSSDLQPVGELLVVKKSSYHKTHLQPVGERYIVKKIHHKKMLKPVGEKHFTKKVMIQKQSCLKCSRNW